MRLCENILVAAMVSLQLSYRGWKTKTCKTLSVSNQRDSDPSRSGVERLTTDGGLDVVEVVGGTKRLDWFRSSIYAVTEVEIPREIHFKVSLQWLSLFVVAEFLFMLGFIA